MLSQLIRAVSLLPVFAVIGIVGLEYGVFVSTHLLPAMKSASDPLSSLALLLEALLFHFFVGCMGVAYYKVVMTGTCTTSIPMLALSLYECFITIALCHECDYEIPDT